MQNENFVYDQIYNRVADQKGSYAYDAKKQRLQEDYRYFYFYDANGNLTQKQAKGLTGEVTNFTYTSENQLARIQKYAASPSLTPGTLWTPASTPIFEASYSYDPTGRRLEKRVSDFVTPANSFVRRYVYDGHEV